MKSLVKVVAMVSLAVVGGATAAEAAGQYVNSGKQTTFYIGTSGNGTGNNFSGGSSYRLNGDAAGSSAPQNFYFNLRRNRSFQADDYIIRTGSAYNLGVKTTGYVGTSSSSTYHTDVSWAAASGATPGRENAYERAE